MKKTQPEKAYPKDAYEHDFYSDCVDWNPCQRDFGFTVRPVWVP